jgi:hypothetical protein
MAAAAVSLPLRVGIGAAVGAKVGAALRLLHLAVDFARVGAHALVTVPRLKIVTDIGKKIKPVSAQTTEVSRAY